MFHNNLLWWSTVRICFLVAHCVVDWLTLFPSLPQPQDRSLIISIYESTVKTITRIKTRIEILFERPNRKIEILKKMELGLFNNKTTVNAHSQLLAVQQQQIQQAATAIDIYRHNKGIVATH